MKKTSASIFLICLSLAACRRESPAHKIVDGIPVITNERVWPAEATRQLTIMDRDVLGLVVNVLSRFPQSNPSFPELSGPNGSNEYTFSVGQTIYGTASCRIQFQDESRGAITPIPISISTSVVRFVSIKETGTSSQFAHDQDLLLELTITGSVTSDKMLTGTGTLQNTTQNIQFRFDPPGMKADYNGFRTGQLRASGSGNGEPASLDITYLSDRTGSGAIQWDGHNGGISLNDQGTGFVISDQTRIILN